MTDLKETVKRPYSPVTLRLDRAIHADLKVLARKDRRSTQNLINLILEGWVKEMKGGKENE